MTKIACHRSAAAHTLVHFKTDMGERLPAPPFSENNRKVTTITDNYYMLDQIVLFTDV